jgi:hypothetical protein
MQVFLDQAYVRREQKAQVEGRAITTAVRATGFGCAAVTFKGKRVGMRIFAATVTKQRWHKTEQTLELHNKASRSYW